MPRSIYDTVHVCALAFFWWHLFMCAIPRCLSNPRINGLHHMWRAVSGSPVSFCKFRCMYGLESMLSLSMHLQFLGVVLLHKSVPILHCCVLNE
ncbi:hypothetical protein GYMLUDRAFT_267070 [Collybiopsis luxurians FD-317 M1]|nr:hypothetical protein GYMLUDRAFT_267070 [Collybiopsis luxurians FD-317 M1]